MKLNVLLILTDEQRFDAAGFNGNPIVRTPHLDTLATRSVNFTRHTCSSPLCTPARASIFTGLYPRTHGAVGVGYTLSPAAPTLTSWLVEAGYHCGLFGKLHLEPELSGSAERLKTDEPYYGFHRTALTEDNLVGPYLDWIRREHPQHEAAAWTQANEGIRAQHGGKDYSSRDTTRLDEVHPSPLPFELSQSLWITRQTEQFIREQKATGTPFFAVCSYVPPHHPQSPPEPFASLYQPAAMPVPERLPASYRPPCWVGGYNYLPHLPDSELQRYIAAYYALCTMLDDCIGRLLQTLRDCDAERDTIIIFTSDHGDYNGDFGLIRKSGPLFDCLLRVPLLIHVPGRAANGSHRDALTQHEDLTPTLLDLLGLPPREKVQGISFAATFNDPAFRPRAHSFFDLTGAVVANGVSDGTWKLLNYLATGSVLTNSTLDPREMQNRAGHVEQAAVQTALEHALYRWMVQTPPAHWPTQYGW